MKFQVVFFGITAVFFAVLARKFIEFNNVQTLPYMDEIFHVSQAQHYCDGNYSHWDNKITTLPGLYIFSQIFLKLWSIIYNKQLKNACSTMELRSSNVVFLALLYVVTYYILKHHQNSRSKNVKNEESGTKTTIGALVISSFPLLYFFTFLYYTDVGSTVFVLCSYYASLKKRHWLSMLAGLIAILFRQTNIVWLGFSCANAILDHLKDKKVFCHSDPLYVQFYAAVLGCLKNFWSIVVIALPYCLGLAGFLVFVIKNEGIVVGDRSSHEACLNFPQLLYFAVFAVLFSSFVCFRYVNIKSNLELLRENLTSPLKLICGIILLIAMVIAVRYFTHIHLYLISDNRHYTFYVWKKIFEYNPMVRYALIPVYFVSFLLVINELTRRCDALWIVVFFSCTAIVVVPQKLLEFRYFIVPYLLFRLNIRQPSWIELIVEGIVYTAINYVTINLFLSKTHTQDGASGQRIMW